MNLTQGFHTEVYFIIILILINKIAVRLLITTKIIYENNSNFLNKTELFY